MNESLHMLKRLTDATGVPGNEGEVRSLMREYLEPHVESFEQDGLGSLFGRVTGKADGPRVMIAGHMDEVGFMVTRIEEGGFLRFQALGGWWNQVLLAQRMDVVTRSGEKIPGSLARNRRTCFHSRRARNQSRLKICSSISARHRKIKSRSGAFVRVIRSSRTVSSRL